MSILKDLKAATVGAGLTLATVFGAATEAEAQGARASRRAPAQTTQPAKPANDAAVKNEALEPAVRQGGYGASSAHSGKNKMMTVQVSGRSLEQLKIDAQEIHQSFRKAKIPTDVVVFYNVDDRLSVPVGVISMNGERFELPVEGSNFPIEDIKERADAFIQYYRKNYALKTPENTPAPNEP